MCQQAVGVKVEKLICEGASGRTKEFTLLTFSLGPSSVLRSRSSFIPSGNFGHPTPVQKITVNLRAIMRAKIQASQWEGKERLT